MFKKKKTKKKILYKAWLENKKQHDELEDIAMKYEVQADKIVVKKVSLAGKFFEGMMDLFYKLGKILIWLLAALIMSAGATAILNPTIRDIMFSYLPFIQ